MAMGMKDFQFGVEVEYKGADRGAVAQAIAQRIGGRADGTQVWMADGRRWTVVYDGSVGSSGGEVVSPILQYGDMETLQEVVRAVRSLGTYADGSCGIHVHIDAAQLGTDGVRNLAKMMAKYEDLLWFALGVADSRAGYCKKMNAGFIDRISGRGGRCPETLRRAWYGAHGTTGTAHYDQSRYHVLNLHSAFQRGTVEFRLFNGTLHAGLIRSYVCLALAMAAKAAKAKGGSGRKLKSFVPEVNSGYHMRVLLVHMGLDGAEFKSVRTHLTRLCKGDTRRCDMPRQAA